MFPEMVSYKSAKSEGKFFLMVVDGTMGKASSLDRIKGEKKSAYACKIHPV